MAPLQVFFFAFSTLVYGIAWFRGGHPERAGVAVLIFGTLVSGLTQSWTLGDFKIGHAAIDAAMLAAFVWLSFRHDRWWLFAASGFFILTVAAHGLMLFDDTLDARGDVAARWGLGVAVIASLLFGVFERWLAGEAPARPTSLWARAARDA